MRLSRSRTAGAGKGRWFVAAALVVVASCPVSADKTKGVQSETPRELGVNLAPAVDYQTGWVFVDVMRTARPWISQTSRAPSGPWDTGLALGLDENGWVERMHDDQAASTLMCREIDGQYPSGRYVCLYEGEGRIDFAFDARVVSREQGRIELDVTPTDSGIHMSIKEFDPANPIRNIRVIMPGFEETYEEQIFHPRFLDSLRPFGVIRFMDWGATNGSFVVDWEDRTRPNHYTQQLIAGVSLKFMIELCNILGADGWFCVPHQATDEYVRSMGELLATRLEPGLKAYVEYSNELWNGQFSQSSYIQQRGLELGLAPTGFLAGARFASRRSGEIFEILGESLPPDRMVRVLSGQASNLGVAEIMVEFEDAWRHADVLAIAPYFDGESVEPDRYPEILGWSVDRIVDEAELDMADVARDVREHRDLASEHGLRLVGYEGGQHLVPPVGTPAFADPDVATLMKQANRSPRMRELYYEYARMWHNEGGDVLCLFNHISKPTKFGSWGLLERQNQAWTLAPKWIGALRYLVDFAGHDPSEIVPDADLDGDGLVTHGDLNLFIAYVAAGDLQADFNGDGVVDSGDISEFIDVFASG